MVRRDDPAAALALALAWAFGPEMEQSPQLIAGETLDALAADGWRLTREPELTVERLPRAVLREVYPELVIDSGEAWRDAAAILAALERDDEAR